jgi:2-methylcitrate dehydratase PrpD
MMSSRQSIDILAERLAGLDYASLPGDVINRAKELILDTIAAAAVGAEHPAVQSALAMVTSQPHASAATILPTGQRGSCQQAAFVNALAARVRDIDDMDEQAGSHPGSTIIMTALALCEQFKRPGSEFLTSIVAGYEAAGRIGRAVSPEHYQHGFHPTGTVNVFGAAAAAGKLWRLDGRQMASALSLAGDQAGGLRQYQVDGDLADSGFHAANAASSGILAAYSARNGYPAAGDMLEGDYGFCYSFCSSFAHKYNPSELLDRWASPFKISQTSFKLYPSTRPVHGAIAGVIELRDRFGVNADALERLVIRTFDMAVKLCDRPIVDDVHQAIFSVQYNVAVALLRGNVTLADFDLSAIQAAEVQRTIHRIEVCQDEELTRQYPTKWGYQIEAWLKDGTQVRSVIRDIPGSPGAPLPPSVIREKARNLIATHQGSVYAEAVMAAIDDLENLQDVSFLFPKRTPT